MPGLSARTRTASFVQLVSTQGSAWCAALFSLTMSMILGCVQEGLPNMVPISGTVVYAGKPLTDGTVLYLPRGQGGRQARGEIQPDGSFRLTTLRQNDGAQVGEYDIVVIALEPHPGEPTREEIEAAGGLIQRGYIIPERYTKRESSGLSDTVDKQHSGRKEIVLAES